MDSDFKFSVGVIGCGRFGKLWTGILLRYFDRVAISDIKTSTVTLFAENKKNVFVQSHKEIATQCKTLFLCVPISCLQDTLKKLKKVIHQNTLVCDTCSIKENPAKWMKEILSAKQAILATHPLFGPDSYKDVTISQNENVQFNKIITFPVRMAGTDYKYWIDIFTQMGLQTIHMDPQKHDKQAAHSQGLTHLVGRVLYKLSLQDTVVSTKGYSALREIVAQTCLDSPLLFKDIQNNNQFSKEVQQKFKKAFQEVLSNLE